MSKVVKFSNSEIERIYFEIEGMINPETGSKLIKGLKEHPIPLSEKVVLRNLSKILQSHYESYTEVRKELIKSYYPEGLKYSDEIEKQMTKDETYLQMLSKLSDLANGSKNESGETEGLIEVTFVPISLAKIADVQSEHDFSWLAETIAE